MSEYKSSTSGRMVLPFLACLLVIGGHSVAFAGLLSTPVSDFVVSSNLASTIDTIKLFDASSKQPTAWLWAISPARTDGKSNYYFVNGTASSSQFPQLRFVRPGKYTVSLTTANSSGTGTTETKINYIEIRPGISMCTFSNFPVDTITAPEGFLFDDGGRTGNYAPNRDCRLIIRPPCGKSIKLTFDSFDVSILQKTAGGLPAGDWLRVYNGINNKGTPLHDSAGYPDGFQNLFPTNKPVLPPAVTAKSGAIYIEWHTDSSGNGKGFSARWSTVIDSLPPPVASISGQSLVYQHQTATFTSTSKGTGLKYSWDLNDDSLPDSYQPVATFTYDKVGVYNIRLVICNCGGADTIWKTLRVIAPTSKPIAYFSANYTRASTEDYVSFTDSSVNAPYKWRWDITKAGLPANVFFQQGGTTSKDIQIQFRDSGKYSVKLRASNDLGTDSFSRTRYIEVYPVCIPNVKLANADMGINRVVLRDVNTGDSLINNISGSGTSVFTSYVKSSPPVMTAGAPYTITISRNTSANRVNSTVWVDFNGDGLFSVYEIVYSQRLISAKNWSATFRVPDSVRAGLTRIRVGVVYSRDIIDPCGNNSIGEFEDYNVLIQPDHSAPVIKIKGKDTLYIQEADLYADAGATASDNADGDLTSSIIRTGAVNFIFPDTYYVQYAVSDRAGNHAIPKVRTVIVFPDTTPPELNLYGPNPLKLKVYQAYFEPGAQAYDNATFNSMSIGISGKVDTARLGTYLLKYTVKDNRGNTTVKYRTVIVQDKTMPELTLLGPDPYKLQLGDHFVDPGFNVTDNYWTNLPVAVSGSVDSSVRGTYTLVYSVTDSSGNGPVIQKRTVRVDDYVAPGLLLDTSTIYLPVFQPFVDPVYSIADNYYDPLHLYLKFKGFVNPYITGTYHLRYYAVDGSGNSSDTAFVTVKVVDTEAPQIFLQGDPVLEVLRWRPYLEPGYLVMDNYDTTVQIQLGGTFKNTQVPGYYQITYTAIDKSGNRSATKSRWISVRENMGVDQKEGLADDFKIFPNPASDRITIEFSRSAGQPVRVELLDILGHTCQLLFNGISATGSISRDTEDIASGLYFVRISSLEQVTTIPLLICK